MVRRLKVLLIAEAANPEWPSVPLVGWSLAKALREHADVHVVTQVRNRGALERAGWRSGHDFTAIDSESISGPIYRFGEALRRATGLGWTFTTACGTLAYYHFEHLLWRQFGTIVKSRQYDLVHRVTPLSPTMPSLIASRCREAGVPFVWGPLNGGVPWPREFAGVQRAEGEWLSSVRGAHQFLPGYRSTHECASATLVGSVTTWNQMSRWSERCVYLPENAVDPELFSVRAATPSTPMRAAFVGRLVPLKGTDMLIEAAVPLVREGRLTLDIIGDGPEMTSLRRQVAEEGIARGVALDGWQEHRGLSARLAQSSVFAFPSVREFGGGAVLEAMALGLVPIVVNYAGPSELVTDATGFRVALGPRASVIAGFRAQLMKLIESPQLCQSMGNRARARVLRWFTWDTKARQVVDIYRWVLGEVPKPDFGMPFPDQ